MRRYSGQTYIRNKKYDDTSGFSIIACVLMPVLIVVDIYIDYSTSRVYVLLYAIGVPKVTVYYVLLIKLTIRQCPRRARV